MAGHVVVFGATGRVGASAVEQALAAGHRVTAAVRRPEALTLRHDALTVVAADTTQPRMVGDALAGHAPGTAVLMAVGTDPLKPSTLVTDSVRVIVDAMRSNGLDRYVGVSGTANMPAPTVRARLSLMPVRRFIKAAADHATAYAIVRDSDLDYALAGCPYIRDGEPKRTGFKEVPGPFPGGFKVITPSEVAAFLVREAVRPTYHRQLVGVWH